MEPQMSVTLTVHARGTGREPGLLVTMPGAADNKFNIPLNEPPEVVAGLVRELAGLVVAHARREVDAVADLLRPRHGRAGPRPGKAGPKAAE